MEYADKPVWALVVMPLLGIAAYLLFGKSDRERYDDLEIGMSAAQVQSIIYPSGGGKRSYRSPRIKVQDNSVIHYNNCMILTMRDGKLVSKKWIGKENQARGGVSPPKPSPNSKWFSPSSGG